MKTANGRSASELKTDQIALGTSLATIVLDELRRSLPLHSAVAGEREVPGKFHAQQVDVSEVVMHRTRLAIEIKPVNLAVGRAIWNRFKDIHSFAMNVHLAWPETVAGGLITMPCYEIVNGRRKSTLNAVEAVLSRLRDIGLRQSAADEKHLLEGFGLVVYDPDTATLCESMVPRGSGLRLDEFCANLVVRYRARWS